MEKREDLIKAAINYLEKNNLEPSKIAVQKIIYFLKEKSAAVPFEFEPFSYGPFSRELSFTADDLCTNQEIMITRRHYKKGPEFSLDMPEEDLNKLNRLMHEFNTLVNENFSFDNLELYGTVIYCFQTLKDFVEGMPTVDEVIQEVKTWKGNKFSDQTINTVYEKIRGAF